MSVDGQLLNGEFDAKGNPVLGDDGKQIDNGLYIKTTISLSEDDGGRGDSITLTGKGFKNSTTITFVRMAGEDPAAPAKPNFTGAQSLCSGPGRTAMTSASATSPSPPRCSGAA